MKIRSVKFNFIMNFILTVSSIVFPMITFPYVTRTLGAAANGKVAFATSVMVYFFMFASLGIPTYGIRSCAKVRDDKEKLSKTVQELLIINSVTMAISYAVFLILLFLVPEFQEEKTLFLINSAGLVLNVIGVTWLYSALEQYAYITMCSMAFKVLALIAMFALVKKPEDYIVYGAITVIASVGSYVLNFCNLQKFVSLKKKGVYNFKQHMKPILVFFAMSAAISVYTNLDIVMLRFMKDNVEVGYYDASIKVKNILVMFVTSLGTVLLPRLSFYVQHNEEKQFEETIKKAFQFVFVIAAPVTVYFMLFARQSILLLAGDDYLAAITPMIVLMPTVLLIGLSNITGIQVLTPRQMEQRVLISILFGAVLDFVLNLILIPQYGAAGAAFATCMAELLVLFVQCIFLREFLKKIVRDMGIWKLCAALIPAGIGSVLVSVLVSGGVFVTLVVSSITFLGIYGVLLLVLRYPLVIDNVKRMFQR